VDAVHAIHAIDFDSGRGNDNFVWEGGTSMNLRWQVFTGIVAAMLSASAAYSASPEKMNWTIDGVQREAIVVSPSQKDPSGKVPVILAFHGHGDDMENFWNGVRFEDSMPTAVIVYPQGLPTNPRDPEGYGWVYTEEPEGQRDLKFVDAMLATMHSKFKVDDQRVYAAGFSNGAMFTYVLWGARAKTFAAFAAVAGRIIPAVHITEPKPIIQIAGSHDTTVPYDDQVTAMKTARTVNGTGEESTSCGKHCTAYPSKNAPVVNFIHGGGHEWPVGTTEMIAKFFASQSAAR
jgi:polyhydroxybutyrate depolymerase